MVSLLPPVALVALLRRHGHQSLRLCTLSAETLRTPLESNRVLSTDEEIRNREDCGKDEQNVHAGNIQHEP